MTEAPRMATGLADYTLADLEALESERPELGRVEVIDGALHATGGSAVGNLHQRILQQLHLLFAHACPPTDLVRIDTWWHSPRGLLRPDVAVYRAGDEPPGRTGAFRVAPQAVVEVLSDDADHDLHRKDAIYAEHGVARRAYLDAVQRHGWWLRLDGVDYRAPSAVWQLAGWPELTLRRDELLAPER
jgi:Uma2 family endonuclease